MPDGTDYLWRPVFAGLCEWADLANSPSKYTLRQVADMNDALDVKEENERRARKAAEDANSGK